MKKIQNQDLPEETLLKLLPRPEPDILVAPLIKSSAQTSLTNDINVGLIGTGAEGQVLMNACLKIPNIQFKAVCDIWEDYNLKRAYRLLKKYGHELKCLC